MRLANKVAIVTGGASGIGRATVLKFVAEGAKVAILDIEGQAELANKLIAEVQAAGGAAMFAAANVANRAQVEAALEAVVKQFGRLDALVANAGITKDAFTVRKTKEGEIKKMSDDQWDAVLNTARFL